mmetsp:Transcript_15876/g.43843  ORF Transcript_15876/g.43843 Transcript_15876/m.43843 type:complete len:364 (-) Transcript_15876:1003-2094(-)
MDNNHGEGQGSGHEDTQDPPTTTKTLQQQHDMPLPNDQQIEIWTRQQLEIAKQVIVLNDRESSDDGDDVKHIDAPFPNFRYLSTGNSKSNDAERYFGGVDVSFPENDDDDAVAVYVILDAATNTVVHQDQMYFALQIPYIPSFLAMREIEPLVELVQRSQSPYRPSVILVDGNGIFHQRHAGIATCLGIRTQIPTIGIGKTLYHVGGWTKDVMTHMMDRMFQSLDAQDTNAQGKEHEMILLRKDAWIPDIDQDAAQPRVDRCDVLKRLAVMGIAVPMGVHASSGFASQFPTVACALVGHGGRTGKRGKNVVGTKNPIYVSVGHRISLRRAIQIACRLSLSRIPEPVRQADLVGRQLLRARNMK